MWEYRGSIRKWIDADTADVTIDVGFHIHVNVRVRLVGSTQGVDVYETHDKDAAKRAIALDALRKVATLTPVFSVVTIRTAKDTPSGGFDRYLAQIITEDGTNVGDVLLREGLAVPYKR